jgi:hypothetical protein
MPVHKWTRVDAGIHLLLADLFPPGRWDPQGLHGLICQRLEQSDERYDLPADEPFTLASYAAGTEVEMYIEHLAPGYPFPEMPLFLTPDRYIKIPPETTYQAAYGRMPAFWRSVLDQEA